MYTPQQNQLLRDGFCVAPAVVPAGLIERLRALADRTLADDPSGYAISKPMCLTYRDAAVREAIHCPELHAAMDAAGVRDVRYYSAVLLNSRPGEGPGGWHHDWWAWESPEATRAVPPELAVFVYLVDTSPANGCLKVVPGTHATRSPWCDGFAEIATLAHDDQVDVPVRAGDVVLCDARVIHGRRGNATAADRPLVTLWFLPEFEAMGAPIRAYAAGAVADDAAEYLGALTPRYEGPAQQFTPNYHRA